MTSERVAFDNGEGRRLAGLLHACSEAAVILCHGFGSGKEAEKYALLEAALAKAGIGSLRFDFFGHGESEGKFEEITLSEGIRDVVAAVTFLRSRGVETIGLCGASYGGAASLFAAPKVEISALALICPAAFYHERVTEELGKEKIAEWKSQGYRFYPTEDDPNGRVAYEFYEDLATHKAEKAAEEIDVPTLVIHGTADAVISFQDSERLASMIGSANLVRLEGADHRISDEENRARLVQEVVSFFKAALANRTKQI